MTDYRDRMGDDPPNPTIPQPRPLEHLEAIPSLAKQLGLEDDMELHKERTFQGESVDDELLRYASPPLSQPNVDILNFWAVGTISSRDSALT